MNFAGIDIGSRTIELVGKYYDLLEGKPFPSQYVLKPLKYKLLKQTL